MNSRTMIVILVSISISSFGWANSLKKTVTNTTVMSLALKESRVQLGINYPFANISGICGIEIRTDRFGQNNSIRDLYKALAIENEYPEQTFNISIPNDMTIHIQLTHSNAVQYYVAGVNISTRNGKSLQDNILATLGKNRQVLVIGTTCQE